MASLSHSYRARQAGKTVASLLAVGVPLLVAVDCASSAWSISLGETLSSWGAL
jgi:hypothetical protein